MTTLNNNITFCFILLHFILQIMHFVNILIVLNAEYA
jgi:hypothetical protein